MKNSLLQLLCSAFMPLAIMDVQTIGANPGFPLNLANHRFSANNKGELVHYVEGEIRATVPPEGWDDYVKYWPSAIDVVKQLRTQAATNAASATLSRAAKIDAVMPAGTDPKVVAAIKAAAGVEAVTVTDPLQDPDVQAAIAVLKQKGIGVTGA
jgi:MinD superfamily P-loop ATPase